MLRKRMVLLYPLIGLALMLGASASTASAADGTCSSSSPSYCPAPTVTTTAATTVNATSAMLNGTVTSGGLAGTCTFNYGTTASYGSVTSPASDYTATASSAPESFLVTGLAPSTTYHFQIACDDSDAHAATGSDVTFTTPATSGPTVITTAASAIGASSATLNGTVNPNGIATSCVFDYGTSTTYSAATVPAKTFAAGFTTEDVSVTLTNLLAPATTYHYQLVCSSGSGSTATTANGGDLTFTTSPANSADTPPAVVTGAASAVTNQSATVSGTVNPNGASTGCYVQYGPTTSYGTVIPDATAFTGSTVQAVSVALTGLTASTLYHYQLVCSNDGGQTAGADATFTTTAATTPPVVKTDAAADVTSVSAVLTGGVVPEGLATTCEFAYGLTTAYGSATAADAVGSSTVGSLVTATVSGLMPSTTYHYELVCGSAGGVAAGGDVTFTTAAATVTKPAISKPRLQKKRKLTIGKNRKVKIKISCYRAACVGKLTLKSGGKIIGSKSYSIAQNKSATVTVKVGAKFLTKLKKKKRNFTAVAKNKDTGTSSAVFHARYKK